MLVLFYRVACELYKGGKLCEPYLEGKQVYVEKRSQEDMNTGVSFNYEQLKEYVKPRCKEYVLPTLCNYAFPPCDESNLADPKPRKFCRDDCLVLKNDVCEFEFTQALRYPIISGMLPECSSMPAVGHPDYAHCIRVVDKGTFSHLTLYGSMAAVHDTTVP